MATTYAVRMPDGTHVPLVVSPKEWKSIVGDPRSETSIRSDCDRGALPTLHRSAGSGSHHRIPVMKALEMLGVPCEVVAVEEAS